MKKPINLVALVLWWVGALLIVADIPIISVGVSYALNETSHTNYATLSAWAAVWAQARFAVVYGLECIGFGVAIELLDQIRWNALPPERQIPRRTLGNVLRSLRHWPHES